MTPVLQFFSPISTPSLAYHSFLCITFFQKSQYSVPPLPKKIKWQHVAQQVEKWSWYLYTTAAQASLHVTVTQWLCPIRSMPDVCNSTLWPITRILCEKCLYSFISSHSFQVNRQLTSALCKISRIMFSPSCFKNWSCKLVSSNMTVICVTADLLTTGSIPLDLNSSTTWHRLPTCKPKHNTK